LIRDGRRLIRGFFSSFCSCGVVLLGCAVDASKVDLLAAGGGALTLVGVDSAICAPTFFAASSGISSIMSWTAPSIIFAARAMRSGDAIFSGRSKTTVSGYRTG
jgi:hypothetical protein